MRVHHITECRVNVTRNQTEPLIKMSQRRPAAAAAASSPSSPSQDRRNLKAGMAAVRFLCALSCTRGCCSHRAEQMGTSPTHSPPPRLFLFRWREEATHPHQRPREGSTRTSKRSRLQSNLLFQPTLFTVLCMLKVCVLFGVHRLCRCNRPVFLTRHGLGGFIVHTVDRAIRRSRHRLAQTAVALGVDSTREIGSSAISATISPLIT